MSTAAEKAKIKVLILRMLVGAAFGAVSTALFLTYVGDPLMELKDPGTILAIVAGLSYVLIGLMVWVGLAAPGVGARFLNVEDADEIREETPKLKSAVVVMILTGGFLLVLAFAGAKLLARESALLLSLACVAGITVAGWLAAKRYDEMTKRMGQEMGLATLQAGMLFLAVWGALAQLDYVEWLSPLALLSGLALLQLLASFVLVAKRGMLLPR